MANHPLNHLNYGHFGVPTYSSEHGSWIFDRQAGHRGVLRQLGEWKEVIPATKAISSSSSRRSNRSLHTAAAWIGHDNADIVPSLDLLPDSAVLSEAVTSATNVYDPATGELLSFGSIGRVKHIVYVAAVPHGEAGNILRLIVLTRGKQGWEGDRGVFLARPSMINGVSSFWAEEGAPIQQICFARTEERTTFLAVRYPGRTVLFRPRLHCNPAAGAPSDLYDLPASFVEPRAVYSIPLDMTGGAPHADVSFNPDYQRQLGIIDCRGSWSIWDIEGNQKGGATTLSNAVSGLLLPEQADPKNDQTPTHDDGWARILWVGDVNTLLVCNRRKLEIHDISGGTSNVLPTEQPVSENSAEWILDVKNHPTNTHLLFVLTTTRLFLMAVICPSDFQERNAELPHGGRVLLSWVHFRGPEDITLQLSVPALAEEFPTIVILHSRMNNIITIYRYQFHEAEPLRPYAYSDPVSLNIRPLVRQSEQPRHISTIHLEILPWKEHHFFIDDEDGPGRVYREEGIQFYRLSVQLSDLSIHEVVCYTLPDVAGFDPQFTVEPLGWDLYKMPRLLRMREIIDEFEDMVVPDGLEGAPTPVLARLKHCSKAGAKRAVSRALGLDELEGQMVDFHPLYTTVTKTTGPGEPEEVTAVLDRAKEIAEDDGSEELPLGTLYEMTERAIVVSDIDKASSSLQELQSESGSREFQPIAPSRALMLTDAPSDKLSMSSLYDTILETWIAPLPDIVPSKLRQTKERLARRVAAEVTLASNRIRESEPVESTQEPPSSFPGPKQDSAVPFPSDALRSSPPPSTPTPAPRILSAIYDPLARLRRHLDISTPAPTVPANISQILMHWTHASDPSIYDYAATTAAIDTTLGILPSEEASLTQKERGRAKRRAERLAKRQKRESEIAMRDRLAESQSVSLAVSTRSSPTPATAGRSARGVGESQPVKLERDIEREREMRTSPVNSSQAFTPARVQSQVEPGRHGGRLFGTPATKKKKKARVSGF